ncbi:MAG: ABC transporter ATP-binding protein [Spirochaetaceae bacterium]
MAEPLVELKDVRKIYPSGGGELEVLSNISLTINQGELVAITGESGCGKSTLLNLIGGLDKPSEGEVTSCGYAVSSLSEKALTDYRNQSLGFVFQFHFLLKDFNTLENVMMPALMAGEKKHSAADRAAELLKRVGLSERETHFPSQLSGGERQRVALARSLMNDPLLILADEPTGNLDERNSRLVEEVLFELTEEFQKTLLLVTHDAALAKKGRRRLHLTQGGVQEL